MVTRRSGMVLFRVRTARANCGIGEEVREVEAIEIAGGFLVWLWLRGHGKKVLKRGEKRLNLLVATSVAAP